MVRASTVKGKQNRNGIVTPKEMQTLKQRQLTRTSPLRILTAED
jgi:hypothetical protein